MDFLVFAPNPWQDLWRNRQQIFSRLAARHRVLYVEPARVSLSDWRRGRVTWQQVRRPAWLQEQPNLWLYRIPATFPTRATAGPFDRATDALLALDLRRALQYVSGLHTLWHYPLPINRSPLPIALALPPYPLALGRR
jgi:hypothetical protein